MEAPKERMATEVLEYVVPSSLAQTLVSMVNTEKVPDSVVVSPGVVVRRRQIVLSILTNCVEFILRATTSGRTAGLIP